jgi:hypothetical protein
MNRPFPGGATEHWHDAPGLQSARVTSARPTFHARIQVSENASIAVVMACPAISRGAAIQAVVSGRGRD